MKHRRVRGIQLVGAEHPTRGNHINRQILRQHGAHLHRRRMRPQHLPRPLVRNMERVLQGARRVVRHKIQGIEIEILRLHLWTIRHLIAHGNKNIRDRLQQRRDRVQRPHLPPGGRHGNIHPLSNQDLGVPLLLQGGLSAGVRLLRLTPRLIDKPSGILPLILRQRPQRTPCL